MTSPPSPWVEYTWDGVDGFLWSANIFSPDVPNDGALALFIAPSGGRGNIPPPTQGLPGLPSPPSAVIVNQVAPGGTLAAPVIDVIDAGGSGTTSDWTLTFSVYSGATGPPATVALLAAVDLSGAGSAQAGDMLVYVPAGGSAAGVAFAPQAVGGWYYPATVNSTTSANGAQRTLCAVSVPAQRRIWTPTVAGQAVIAGTGPNVLVNLVARLNATSGSQVGIALSLAGQTPPPLILSSGIPAGSASGFGQVAAGAAAVIFLQAEQQSGSDSFTTSAAATQFGVKVDFVP